MTNASSSNFHTLSICIVVLCFTLAAWGLGRSAWLIATEGVGVLGVTNDIPWGWDIVQFVFWIGIGHAGTLISAILLLFGQQWRREIARHAELMTLCAVCTAGVFPLIHVGRFWMIWQMAPLPLPSGVWPNLSSALVWDAVAICSYFLLSILFWITGILGDRIKKNLRPLWARTCFLMAILLTPLVVTVHSVVGCDFSVLLRWNAPYVAPFFVCGALLSGMAAVQIIALCRQSSTEAREKLAKLTLWLAAAMGLFYGLELLHHPMYWDKDYATMFGLNVVLPLLYSIGSIRQSRIATVLLSGGILYGMWLERSHIVIGRSIAFTGGSYSPSLVDISMLIGSIGLFLGLYILISLYMPPEKENPLNYTEQAPSSPGWWAFIGGTAGIVITILWSLTTQECDTAGILTGRPHSLFFQIPAIFVAGVFGAGVSVFLHFLHRLRRV